MNGGEKFCEPNSSEVGLWYFADINPSVPGFSELNTSDVVDFLPLENIWPGGKAIYGEQKKVSGSESYTKFKRGDILVPKVTPTVFHGRSMIAEISTGVGLATSEVHVLRAKPNADSRWLTYQMLASKFINAARGEVYGVGGLQRISTQFLSAYPVKRLDLSTQRRIADYLDTEVGEMDAMVARLEKLIADLEARRAKVIGRTLSEHVESVSGEWPHHAFKFLLTTHFAGDWGEDVGKSDIDLPCVRVADFERTTSSLAEEIPTVRSYAGKTVERKHLKYNDLLVEKSGGGEKTPVGSVVLYQGDNNALCANFIEVMRLNREQHPPFWVHMFRANFVDGETFRFVKQTTGIQNLDMQMFLDQVFVVPPLEQQRRIAAELDKETAAIDGIIARSRTLIDDLKARKSALITEVVTGRKQV